MQAGRGFQTTRFSDIRILPAKPGRSRTVSKKDQVTPEISLSALLKKSIGGMSRDYVNVYYVDFVLPGLRGMTVPPFGIFIRKDCSGDHILLHHELVHWQQYQEMGLLRFYAEYFRGLVSHGYWNSPMEVEARLRTYEYFSQ